MYFCVCVCERARAVCVDRHNVGLFRSSFFRYLITLYLFCLNTGPRPSSAKLSNVIRIPETSYKYPDLPINRCKEEVKLFLSDHNSAV